MLANAGKDTVFKVAAGEEGGSQTTLFYTVKGAFIAIMALFILGVVQRQPLIHGPTLPWAVPIGVIVFVTYTLALRSLVSSDASVGITVFRLNFVLSSAFAALFMGEGLTARKVIGLCLGLGAVLVFFAGSRGTDRGTRNHGILLAFLACLCGAALNILNKVALNAGASILHLIMYRYIVVCALGGILLAAQGQSAIPTRRLLVTSSACAVLMLASLLFLLTALSAGEVTVIIPISQLSFLFTALLSFLFLREKLNLAKIVGIVVAFASIAVLG
jgi:drug/metabolite transporter (DMT)-like permease